MWNKVKTDGRMEIVGGIISEIPVSLHLVWETGVSSIK
jgi:hypothetical protein